MPTNNKKLQELIKSKKPGELRQTIRPINIIKEATGQTERENRTEDSPEITGEETIDQSDEVSQPGTTVVKNDESVSPEMQTGNIVEENVGQLPAGNSIEKKRSQTTRQKSERNKRTKKGHRYSEQDIHTLLANDKRETTRYSFEIYLDQRDDIQDICDRYEELTGKKLSASRLLREVIDDFLPDALKAFGKDDRVNRTEN
jgi:hypothetical protein